MVSLEQVRALEARVEKAVALIASLKSENGQLRTRLEAADGRVAELEGMVQLFQRDQQRIEEGIVHALKKLDFFEDAVHAAGSQLQAKQPQTEQPVAEQPVAEQPVAEEAEEEPLDAEDSEGPAEADQLF